MADTPESKTSNAISKRNFESLQRRVRASANVISEETSSMGATVKAAVENQHLHKGAYSIFRKIERVRDGENGETKAQELLFHLDVYLRYAGIRDQQELPLGSPESEPDFEDEDDEETAELHA